LPKPRVDCASFICSSTNTALSSTSSSSIRPTFRPAHSAATRESGDRNQVIGLGGVKRGSYRRRRCSMVAQCSHPSTAAPTKNELQLRQEETTNNQTWPQSGFDANGCRFAEHMRLGPQRPCGHSKACSAPVAESCAIWERASRPCQKRGTTGQQQKLTQTFGAFDQRPSSQLTARVPKLAVVHLRKAN
jgi:hypothetical protein